MTKHTLKILLCGYFKIFRICLVILGYYERRRWSALLPPPLALIWLVLNSLNESEQRKLKKKMKSKYKVAFDRHFGKDIPYLSLCFYNYRFPSCFSTAFSCMKVNFKDTGGGTLAWTWCGLGLHFKNKLIKDQLHRWRTKKILLNSCFPFLKLSKCEAHALAGSALYVYVM